MKNRVTLVTIIISSSSVIVKSNLIRLLSMIYLCRFRQRNRLIEIPIEEQNLLTHEYRQYLIS